MQGIDDLPEALARLVALGQAPDVNIRPVLLRVVVDLFVSKPHHAPADLVQFEAIVTHLLDEADAPTRAIVATKLAAHPMTPRSLVARFLDDDVGVAVAIYAGAVLDEAVVLSAASWGPAPVARAVAGRPDLGPETVAALAARPEDEVLHALVANATVALARPAFQQMVRRAKDDDTLAALLVERPADPIDLAPLFPIVRAEQRQAIIEAARRLELGKRQWGRLDGVAADTLARLDCMVLAGERDGFEIALGVALGIDAATMVGLLQDEGGEILALGLAAVGASPDMAARVFILGDPRIGRSVTRVRALTAVVASLSSHAARRLLSAMAITGDTPRHAPQTPARPGARRPMEPMVETAPARRDPAGIPARRLG